MRFVLAGLGSALGLVAALPVVLLAAPFWLVSALTETLHALWRRLAPGAADWPGLIQYEPELGWRPRPDLATRAKGDRVFRISTDAEGWRGKGTLEESRLVVFGDSFAFGYGVSDRHFFADRHPSVPMKAVGANGYSLVHGLLWMQRLQPRLRGKVVAWMVYYGNDLVDNLTPNLDRYRMPFLRATEDGTGWEVVHHHVSPEPWPVPSRRSYYDVLAEICTPGPLSDRVFSAGRHLVAEADALCRDVGARLVVVGLPDVIQLTAKGADSLAARAPDTATCDARLPDRRLAEACAELGVPFVSLADHLTAADYNAGDGHWTPKGHRRVAHVLGDLVHRFPLEEGPPRPARERKAEVA